MLGKFLRRRLDQIRSVVPSVLSADALEWGVGADVLFFAHDVDYSATFNSRFLCSLLDPVRLKLHQHGVSTESVGLPYSRIRENETHLSRKLANRRFLKARIVDKYLPRVGPRKFSWEEELWTDIIQESNARMLVTIGTPPALARAAHKLGIQLIEVLHGYRFASIPWNYNKRLRVELPDLILTLDDVSRTTFMPLFVDNEHCLTVRNPWHDFLCEDKNSSLFELKHSAKYESQRLSIQRRPRVALVCLQWGYGRHEMFDGMFPNELFPDELGEVIDRTIDEITWIFRLHPVQIREERYRHQRKWIREFVNSHPNTLEFDSDVSLFELLSLSDYHLSPCSGSTSEALAFGIPCVFFDTSQEMLHELRTAYSDEFEHGRVFSWSLDPDRLIDWLGAVSRQEGETSSPILTALDVILGQLPRHRRTP